ncbi:heme-binding protein [Geminicoccus flavidas]|uniref:heme-binding protein n=1 Tax=Geminicoccus flavidas TaxID=2506407 RepID=UPI00190F2FE4|nr:heme-binding protein [Geminicoccus flavidas]
MASSDNNKPKNVSCPATHAGLRAALVSAVKVHKTQNMWAVAVNRGGVVCAVAFSGAKLSDQWLLSRQIAAAKAFTANGLSNSPAQKFTTAQLYDAVQPGGPLYGLAAGNPVDPDKAYDGPQSRWGTARDPMVGKIVGGTITFGGGTPIQKGSQIVGGVGVSGDTAANDQKVSDTVAGTLK